MVISKLSLRIIINWVELSLIQAQKQVVLEAAPICVAQWKVKQQGGGNANGWKCGEQQWLGNEEVWVKACEQFIS